MTFKQKLDSLTELVLNRIYRNIPEKDSLMIRELFGDILVEADDGNLYPIYCFWIDHSIDPIQFIVMIQLDHPESESKEHIEELCYVEELKLKILVEIADKLQKINAESKEHTTDSSLPDSGN